MTLTQNGTMYSSNVLCNACNFYSLFVWLSIFSNPNPKPNLLQYQKESPKLHFGLSIVQLNSFWNLNIQQIIIQSSQLFHIWYIAYKIFSCSPFSNQTVNEADLNVYSLLVPFIRIEICLFCNMYCQSLK